MASNIARENEDVENAPVFSKISMDELVSSSDGNQIHREAVISSLDLTPINHQKSSATTDLSPDDIVGSNYAITNDKFLTPKKKDCLTVNHNSKHEIPKKENSLGSLSSRLNREKTPQKRETRKNHLQCEVSGNKSQSYNEEEMISEVEQAKQLIIETETYLKSLEKTPVKQITSHNSQNLSKYSPGTPGRHKRVNLITLDSPKAKKLRSDLN